MSERGLIGGWFSRPNAENGRFRLRSYVRDQELRVVVLRMDVDTSTTESVYISAITGIERVLLSHCQVQYRVVSFPPVAISLILSDFLPPLKVLVYLPVHHTKFTAQCFEYLLTGIGLEGKRKKKRTILNRSQTTNHQPATPCHSPQNNPGTNRSRSG